MWPFENMKKQKEKAERSTIISVQETTKEIEKEKMITKLKEILNQPSKEIIFVCIGSDRSTGDSLGPLVGTMLKEKNFPYLVYGTLQAPVHALNIKKVLKNIQDSFEDPFIFGIDACLGDESKIGSIYLSEGSFIPGKALNKSLPSVGDYHIKAVVNYLDPISSMQTLNNTRLYSVMRMAEMTTNIIMKATELIGEMPH